MSDADSIAGSLANHRVFSIGHSNIALETFIDLLLTNHIDVLVDVRSHPYSKFAPHFSRNNLEGALHKSGIKYIYLGKELGGKPESEEFYAAEGYAKYGSLARSSLFLEGIHRLESGVDRHRVAVMCSEEDPKGCHRRLLIGRVLAERGIRMDHIRGDGRLQMEEELKREESGEGVQIPMFEPEEDANWRSVKRIRSASPSDERQTSLEH